MNNTEHVYALPRVIPASDIPTGVRSFLNGQNLLSKTQALCLSTVDAEGWPHTALLSAGDVLALPSGRLRFAIFAGSGTAANLVRDGRLTLSMSLDGGMCELRMRVRTSLRPRELRAAVFLLASRAHKEVGQTKRAVSGRKFRAQS